MLKAFDVPEGEAVVIVNKVVVMHYGIGFRQLWEDIVIKDPLHVFFHVSAVEGDAFIPVEPEAGS